MPDDVLQQTYNFALAYHQQDHTGHDFEHIQRVYVNICKLLEQEPLADSFICKMSALLHDVDDHKLNTDGNVAKRFLQSLKIKESVAQQILETIDAISFSKSGAHPKFKTLEMKLLSDADKLDAMGAIGICRALIYGAAKERPLFNATVFPDSQNNQARTYSINHFFDKLLRLKGAMQTKTGQQLAEERHQFMIQFLHQFFSEQELTDWHNYLDDYLNKL